jgi:hypothetical protein
MPKKSAEDKVKEQAASLQRTLAQLALANRGERRELLNAIQPKYAKGAAGDSQPKAGDSLLKVTGDSLPKATGDSLPKVTGDALPKVTGDALPKVTGDSLLTGDSLPKVTGDALPKVPSDAVLGKPKPSARERMRSPKTKAADEPKGEADKTKDPGTETKDLKTTATAQRPPLVHRTVLPQPFTVSSQCPVFVRFVRCSARMSSCFVLYCLSFA